MLKTWLTKGIMTSVIKKNILYRKFIRARSDEEKTTLYNQFKAYRNTINKLTKFSKGNHYQKYFHEHKKNTLKTWNGIKSIININKKKKKGINCLKVDDQKAIDPFLISNYFNKFFTKMAKKIESKIIQTDKKYPDFLDTPLEKTFFLTPTEPNEERSLIKTLNLKKTTGPNSRPTKLLKVFDKTLRVPLANLINLSFEKEIFPKPLKIASAIPMCKKGDYLDCNNYRPIPLTLNISKLLARLIHSRLYSFLENNKVTYNRQFAFRNNHSTTHALIDITEKIRSALNKGIFACDVYVDLQKAFDTVNHSILMNKLEYYEIRSVPKMWLENFLIGRQQFTHMKNKSSCKLPITLEVPQRSVLALLLFLLYINNVHKAIQHNSVHHFADDTILLNL